MGRDYPGPNQEALDSLKKNHCERFCLTLCIDISGSMRDKPIKELNKAINNLYQQINNDNKMKFAADIALVTFSDKANVASYYSQVKDKNPVNFVADGYTAMGKGMKDAIEIAKKRNQEYRDTKTPHYHPFLILFSDGYPEGDDDELRGRMQAESCRLEREEGWIILPVGVGDDYDAIELGKFSSKFTVSQINKTDFSAFFDKLVESVNNVVSGGNESAEAQAINNIFKINPL